MCDRCDQSVNRFALYDELFASLEESSNKGSSPEESDQAKAHVQPTVDEESLLFNQSSSQGFFAAIAKVFFSSWIVK